MATGAISKYVEIANVIETQLLGQPGAKVPSARDVARAYSVSIVTASRAIQVLKDKGLVRTVERSGSFIATKPSAGDGTERYALVLRSTPGPWFQASITFSRAGFTSIERQLGAQL